MDAIALTPKNLEIYPNRAEIRGIGTDRQVID